MTGHNNTNKRARISMDGSYLFVSPSSSSRSGAEPREHVRQQQTPQHQHQQQQQPQEHKRRGVIGLRSLLAQKVNREFWETEDWIPLHVLIRQMYILWDARVEPTRQEVEDAYEQLLEEHWNPTTCEDFSNLIRPSARQDRTAGKVHWIAFD